MKKDQNTTPSDDSGRDCLWSLLGQTSNREQNAVMDCGEFDNQNAFIRSSAGCSADFYQLDCILVFFHAL